jgi:large subunit ribosomal protein L20
MARVKAGTTRTNRHKKVLKATKGFRGRASTCYKVAKIRHMKALEHSYKGRKQKKRDYRALWIIRINAAVREQGMKYSEFICGISKLGIEMNRKMLSNLCISSPESFVALVEKVKAAA